MAPKSNGNRAAVAPYAPCRVLGHEWHHLPPLREGGGVLFTSACAHCETTRSKWLSRNGGSYVSKYRYPKGYSQHGDDRLDTVQWRRLLITSAVEA